MTYLEMCNRGTNAWKIARKASLAQNTTTVDRNRLAIKSFFRILHFMTIKNWAYTHNFHDLVIHCGGKEISTHLIMASKNTTYISPEYISNYIYIMDEFVKKPLHSTMKGNKFTFHSDERQDITTVEQFALCVTFIMNGEVKEHLIG